MKKHLSQWVAIFLIAGMPALVRALPAPADTTATAETAATAASASPWLVTAGVAAANLHVNGNARRYEQYVTPPEGLYLNLLKLQYLSPTGKLLLDASGQNLGETSANGEAWLVAGGTIALQGQERNSRFFRDWSAGDEPFKRHDNAYALSLPAGPGALRVSYNSVALQQQGADPEEDWSRTVPGIDYTADINNWQASAGFDRETFTFDAGPQFSGETEALRFAFSPPSTGRTALEASAALLQTDFDELAGSQNGNLIDLRGVHALSRDWTLIGDLSRREITDTIIQNTYVKRDLGGEVRAEYRGLPNTTLELGALRNRLDYVVRTQAGVVTTDQDGYFARATARLTRQLKLRVSQTRTWLDNPPTALDLEGLPTGSLVWTSKNDVRGELTYAPTWRSGFTGRYRKVHWVDSEMTTGNDVLETGLTGWWMPRETLTLYATYLRQHFDLHGITLDNGLYVSNDETMVYGASFQATPRLALDLALTDSDARGATGVDQNNLWLGVGYTLPCGTRLGLRASLGDFDTSDEAPLLNYDHNWIELGVSRIVF